MIASFLSLKLRKGFGAYRQNWSRVTLLVVLGWITIPVVFGTRILFDNQSSRSFEQPALSEELRLVGKNSQKTGIRTQSCSTSSCHGSLILDSSAGDIRRDEYYVWLDDPHAQAYRTLFSQRSRDIFHHLGVADRQLRPLAGQADNFQRQWNNCLACHETNTHLSLSAAPIVRSDSVAEGVSCESCHGNSQDWLHLHYRRQYWASSDDLERAKLKNVSGSEIASKVKQCTVCHVGGSIGDVNHDLISAGHPALKFEYVWYKSRLPKHWKADRHTANNQPAAYRQIKAAEGSTKAWLIGQLVTASAFLEQLERRAQKAETSDSTWPEFAEHNCFACHHDLNEESWRQKRGFPELGAIGQRRSQLPVPWGNWSLEVIQILADQFGSEKSQDFSRAFGRLREDFQEGHVPVSLKIVNQSTIARGKLEEWLHEVRVETDQSDRVATRVLRQIGQNYPNKLISSWDQTATIILGFAAYHRDSNSIHGLLEAAMSHVRFPDAIESPRDFLSVQDKSLPAKSDELIELLKRLAESIPDL